MNIHEISRKSGIPLNRLRKLEKMDVLTCDKANEAAEQIRRALWRQSRLSVSHLLAMIDDPSLIEDMGSVAVQERAQRQLDALGDLSQGKAPPSIAFGIPDAHRGLPVALRALRRYVEENAPPFGEALPFHWFAVRILLGAPAEARADISASLNMAFAKLRAVPEFAGWWTKDPDGIIKYHQPKIKHDL